MISRMAVSWSLVRASARMFARYPELIVFPILSIMATILLFTGFIGVLFAASDFDLVEFFRRSYFREPWVIFIFYLISYTVIFYANTGLVGAAMMLMDGERPTLGDSVRIANKRIGAILGYALIMATVGLIFRIIFRRTGITGRLTGSVLRRSFVFAVVGLAWHLIPYLVVPILVEEGIGPIKAIRRSAQLIKQTWGEQVVSYASIGLIFMVMLVGPLALGSIVMQRVLPTYNEALIVTALYASIMLVLTMFLVKLALEGIFCTVAYRYACARDLTSEFDPQLLEQAFRAKESTLPGWFGRRHKDDQASSDNH